MFSVRLDEITEEGLNLVWKEERDSILAYLGGFSQIDFDFEAPLQANARISKAGKSILIRGMVQTVLQLRCVRCLKEFFYPFSSAFSLTLYPSTEASCEEEAELTGEDMESSFFEGGEIKLSEIACEQILLEIPYQPLCQEGCKGLCSICVKDLNLSACECVKEEWTSGFSGLNKLKLD